MIRKELRRHSSRLFKYGPGSRRAFSVINGCFFTLDHQHTVVAEKGDRPRKKDSITEFFFFFDSTPTVNQHYFRNYTLLVKLIRRHRFLHAAAAPEGSSRRNPDDLDSRGGDRLNCWIIEAFGVTRYSLTKKWNICFKMIAKS